MKKTYTILFYLITFSQVIFSQGTWNQKSNFSGTARGYSSSFSIANKGYIVTGNDGGYKNDLWEYDSSTDLWSQKVDFAGGIRDAAVGFSIGAFGYVCTGYDGSYKNDLWMYDPSSNSWIQKANFPGIARNHAVAFTIGNKAYVGTGNNGSTYFKDFWEYNPISDSWTQIADFGGVGRNEAVAFSMGNKGYLGTGYDGTTSYNDFWEYDPSNNSWLQKTNFGGSQRRESVGFSIGSYCYIGTGFDTNYTNDFWEFDLTTNSWIQIPNFPGSARHVSTAFSIGSKAYLGTGSNSTYLNDFWEFSQNNFSNCLVSYYPFNGNANDSTNMANNGIVSGATLTSDRFGNSNSAYSFNGTSDYIEIPHIANYNGSELTLAFWAKGNIASSSTGGGFGVNPGILTKVDSTGTYPPSSGFYIYEIGGQANLSFAQTSGSLTYTGASNNFTDSLYHFISITYKQNDTLKYYIDNVLWYYSTGVNIISNTEPIRLGKSNSPFWKPFEGVIDDIRIYNCAISDDELTTIYNNFNTNIQEEVSTFNFQVYPNPATSEFNIVLNTLGEIAQLEIYSQIGQLIKNIKLTGKTTKISTDDMKSGVYYLKLNSSGNEVVKKVLLIN